MVLTIFIVMALFGGIFLNKNIYFWYIWNVFLAIIPLILSFVLAKFYREKRSGVLISIIFIAWLLFLPNAFYVLTDFIHISDLSFYFSAEYAQNNTNYILNIRPWYELVITSLAFIISLICGVFSLLKMAQIVRRITEKINYHMFIVVISALCGFGIYIGRFLRFNSWDIFNPFNLVVEIIESLNMFALEFTFLMTVFIIFCIYFVKACSNFSPFKSDEKIDSL